MDLQLVAGGVFLVGVFGIIGWMVSRLATRYHRAPNKGAVSSPRADMG